MNQHFNRTIVCKNRIELFVKFINVINALYRKDKQMNDIQIDILALALSLDGELNRNNRFNTAARAYIRKELQLGMSNLTNNLKSLKDKGILYVNEHGNLCIHKSLLIITNTDEPIALSFVLKPEYDTDREIILDLIDSNASDL